MSSRYKKKGGNKIDNSNTISTPTETNNQITSPLTGMDPITQIKLLMKNLEEIKENIDNLRNRLGISSVSDLPCEISKFVTDRVCNGINIFNVNLFSTLLRQVSELKNAIPNIQDQLNNPDAIKNFKFSEEQLRDTLRKSISSNIPKNISTKYGDIDTNKIINKGFEFATDPSKIKENLKNTATEKLQSTINDKTKEMTNYVSNEIEKETSKLTSSQSKRPTELKNTQKTLQSKSINTSKKNTNNKKEPLNNQSGGNSRKQLYDYIIHPKTNRKVSIYSKTGLDILEKYAVQL